MNDPRTVLDGTQIDAAGLADWRPLFGVLTARFRTGDFATGLELVRRVGEAAEAADHHPDVELSYPAVTVRLSSHDVGGITSRDLDLARATTDIAAALGVSAEPAQVSALELALDTHDVDAVKPFWAAVLGHEEQPGNDDLVDPAGRMPSIWFQDAEPSGDVPQRWHLDVRIPPEQVRPRIDAALAAGGTLVDDSAAPRYWVLADPQGNKVCLTTWQGRSRA